MHFGISFFVPLVAANLRRPGHPVSLLRDVPDVHADVLPDSILSNTWMLRQTLSYNVC